MTTFSDFQNQASSEKIGLCVVEASTRLVGWSIYSGSVYSVACSLPAIVSIEDSGTAYTDAGSIAGITAGKYFWDRSSGILYVQASDSSNPNGRFLVCTFRSFFANAPVYLPNDLSTGYAVEWIPLLKPLSEFGVELDNVNQMGVAIEGSGSVKFHNDQSYWASRFDKYYFENNRCYVYSCPRNSDVSEVKLIYKGRVQSKAWTLSEVSFSLKDSINELRAPVISATLADLVTSAPVLSDGASKWLQRRVYGSLSGFRPANIDHAPNDEKTYSGTGSTWVVTNGSNTVTLSSGSFLDKDLIEGDEIRFNSVGDETFFTIQTVTSTTLTLSESFAGFTTTSPGYTIKFARPETLYNRKFYIASHRLRSISTTITAAISLNRFYVADPTDLQIGDYVTIGSESSPITGISGSLITTAGNFVSLPSAGTPITKPSVTNVYLDGKPLDAASYSLSWNGEASLITLTTSAEFNAASSRKLAGSSVQFTSGLRSVTGTGTFFKSDIKPRDWIKASTQSTWYQVASIESDTALTLRSVSGYTANVAAFVKSPDYYSEGRSVLSCDITGATSDGLSTGSLLKYAPSIAKDLLTFAGYGSGIVGSSFDSAADLAQYRVAVAIPDRYDATSSPSVRDILNRLNQSVFGSVSQNEDFLLEYAVFRPSAPETVSTLYESDILSFAVKSSAEKVSKTIVCEYGSKEYDITSQKESFQTKTTTNRAAQYLAKSTKEHRIKTLLVDPDDALLMAERTGFVLEVATSIVSIKTKLQGARIQVTDKLIVDHSKLYERFGSTSKQKLASVHLAKKSHSDSAIELDDLANAFSRCAKITASSAASWSIASDSEKARNGYITDSYGMQNNAASTFGVNLIW